MIRKTAGTDEIFDVPTTLDLDDFVDTIKDGFVMDNIWEHMSDEDREVYEDIEAYEKELKDNPDWANEIYRGWDETTSSVYTPMEWVADKEKNQTGDRPPVHGASRGVSCSFGFVAPAHAFVGGVAGVGHGRGGHLDALQGAQPLFLFQVAAGFHRAMDALMLLFGHGNRLLSFFGVSAALGRVGNSMRKNRACHAGGFMIK